MAVRIQVEYIYIDYKLLHLHNPSWWTWLSRGVCSRSCFEYARDAEITVCRSSKHLYQPALGCVQLFDGDTCEWEDDEFDFAERFTSLKAEFEAQLKEEAQLNKRIHENLNKIQFHNG